MKTAINNLLWLILWVLLPAAMAEMARILREKHGIEWKSSSQLRPWRHQ